LRLHGSLYDLDTDVTINFTTGRVREEDEDFDDRLVEDEDDNLGLLRAKDNPWSRVALAASLVAALLFPISSTSSSRMASVANM
jgi:hypothetical protein